ncbi:hypothetical protein ACFYY5_29070 [Nocardia elegans]|uniref:Uncharacterized protein n=1 Tax=Nocardia elegans TaxID=300029 RepID=A0ABW6TLD1_9NOCA
MSIDKRHLTDCRYYLRQPSTEHPGKFVYTRLYEQLPMGALGAHLPHPPAIGDTVPIYSRENDIRGRFVVVARHWEQISYGSPSWPHIENTPTIPRILTLFVEPAPDMFADEAPSDEDDE